MSAKSLYPFRMDGRDRRRYQAGSVVTVAHPMKSPAPLSVPHFVSKPGYLTEGLHLGKELHHRGSHLFDVTKPHANVEPVQNRAGSLRNYPAHDAAQPVRAVCEHGHHRVGVAALILKNRFHMGRSDRLACYPGEMGAQLAVFVDAACNDVKLSIPTV